LEAKPIINYRNAHRVETHSGISRSMIYRKIEKRFFAKKSASTPPTQAGDYTSTAHAMERAHKAIKLRSKLIELTTPAPDMDQA
jgi:hypothetical protein